jgi:hypothetical protein
MLAVRLLIGLATFGQPAPLTGRTAADSVILPDGKVVLGQLLESDRRGPVLMVVRRDWARANLPDRLAAWEQSEAPVVRRAEAQRRERLTAWRRDRATGPDGGERINAWLDGELARPVNPEAKSSLLVIRLTRTEARTVSRKSRKDQRMLRLGWLSDFPEVETMTREDLAQGLDGRGFATDLETPVSLEPLLPPQPEDEARWLVRRAATEALNEPGGRLIRFQGMVMPEPEAGQAPPAGASLNAAVGAIRELLGEAPPPDPLPSRLNELARQGRSSAVVTRLELAADFSAAAVETTLWVRSGNRWYPADSRSVSVRPEDLPAGAGDGLADDPQVQAAFGLIGSLGLGEVAPDLKRRSLAIGGATRKALGEAKGALNRDLETVAISLDRPRQPDAGAGRQRE